MSLPKGGLLGSNMNTTIGAPNNRANEIKSLYSSILGRDADAGGLDFYKNSGKSLEDITNSLKASTEYTGLLGKASAQKPVAPVAVSANSTAPAASMTAAQPQAAGSFDVNGYLSGLNNKQLKDIQEFGPDVPAGVDRGEVMRLAGQRLTAGGNGSQETWNGLDRKRYDGVMGGTYTPAQAEQVFRTNAIRLGLNASNIPAQYQEAWRKAQTGDMGSNNRVGTSSPPAPSGGAPSGGAPSGGGGNVTAESVNALYREFLGRDAKQGGLDFYLNSGKSLDEIGADLKASKEGYWHQNPEEYQEWKADTMRKWKQIQNKFYHKDGPYYNHDVDNDTNDTNTGGGGSETQTTTTGGGGNVGQPTISTGGGAGPEFDNYTGGPQITSVPEDESSAGRLGQMLDSDSPLMQQAQTSGMKFGNSRGLLNSSIAAGAAQDAMIRNAQPFATNDSQLFARQRLNNQDTNNAFGLQWDGQDWKSGENALDRSHALDMQGNEFNWKSGENAMDRDFQSTMKTREWSWLAGENAADRQNRLDSVKIGAATDAARLAFEATKLEWQADQAAADRDWRTNETAAERDFRLEQEGINRDDRWDSTEDAQYKAAVAQSNDNYNRRLAVIDAGTDTAPATKTAMRQQAKADFDAELIRIAALFGRGQ